MGNTQLDYLLKENTVVKNSCLHVSLTPWSSAVFPTSGMRKAPQWWWVMAVGDQTVVSPWPLTSFPTLHFFTTSTTGVHADYRTGTFCASVGVRINSCLITEWMPEDSHDMVSFFSNLYFWHGSCSMLVLFEQLKYKSVQLLQDITVMTCIPTYI